MALENGALLKGALGIALVGGGGAAAYYGYRHINYTSKAESSEAGERRDGGGQGPSAPKDKSKYDDALLEFLKNDKHDIVFEVKRVAKNGQTEAESEIGENNSIFSNGQSSEFVARVRVKTSDTNQFKVSRGQAVDEVNKLKEKHGNQDWTWTCDLKLHKKATTSSEAHDVYKTQIGPKGSRGLLTLLRKDLTAYNNTSGDGNKWTKEQLKQEKKEFIGRCAKERASSNSRWDAADAKANEADLKVTKEFEFGDMVKASVTKLGPKDEAVFNQWFKTEYGTKTHQ